MPGISSINMLKFIVGGDGSDFLLGIQKWREIIWICITDRSSFKHNVSRVYGMAFAHNLYKQFYDYKWHKIQYEAATFVSFTWKKNIFQP